MQEKVDFWDRETQMGLVWYTDQITALHNTIKLTDCKRGTPSLFLFWFNMTENGMGDWILHIIIIIFFEKEKMGFNQVKPLSSICNRNAVQHCIAGKTNSNFPSLFISLIPWNIYNILCWILLSYVSSTNPIPTKPNQTTKEKNKLYYIKLKQRKKRMQGIIDDVLRTMWFS